MCKDLVGDLVNQCLSHFQGHETTTMWGSREGLDCLTSIVIEELFL
uniref:Uncharacterized protein n=1 Tax=Rhizophora mucronata TaxID=61149 RepID=A0A2P2QPA3_RHIMU